MELVPLSPFLKITHSPFPNYTRYVLLPWSLCYPTVAPTTPPSWFSWQAVAKYHFLNLFQQASPSYNPLSPWYIINLELCSTVLHSLRETSAIYRSAFTSSSENASSSSALKSNSLTIPLPIIASQCKCCSVTSLLPRVAGGSNWLSCNKLVITLLHAHI